MDVLAPTEILLKVYEPEIVEILERVRHLVREKSQQDQRDAYRALIDKLWPNEEERIQNTHWITTKEHGLRLMRWNKTQRELYRLIRDIELDGSPVRIVIVKARQLGVSAFIQSFFYDRVNYRPNTASMTVNYEEKVTEELFQKAKLIHDMNIGARPTTRSSTGTIQFRAPHNGTFHTLTAGSKGAARSLTFQYLHASEVPLWPDPEGSFYGMGQSVPLRPNTTIIAESTARGAHGMFYDLWNDACDRKVAYRPFFAPWTWDDNYSLPFQNEAARKDFLRRMSPTDARYQKRYNVTDEQMHWRSQKIATELLGNENMFRQEFPITADEAFLTSGAPVFDPEWIQHLRDSTSTPLWTGDVVLANAPQNDL